MHCSSRYFSMGKSLLVVLITTLSTATLAQDKPSAEQDPYTSCLQEKVLGASPEKTVRELQQECRDLTLVKEDKTDTLAEELELSSAAVATNSLTLLQHRTSYLLPFAYNFSTESEGVGGLEDDIERIDYTEFKFRLSFKTLAWNNILGSNAKLYAAYTNTSWWQAYNSDESRPFRETNHEPEFFLNLPANIKIGSWELDNLALGISHISNGRSGDFSRTWNRIYAEVLASNERNILRFRPWVSISNMNDNPDIEEFRGRAEIGGRHFRGNHIFNWQVRHTLDDKNRASIEADWSFPLRSREDLRFFVQYFDGYGESLIDYNRKSRRLGLGFKLGN